MYNDDLIVVGSGCIGLDCSDGLTFNGHELVLKENNLRIAFGSAEKFRLSANHTANGGASEFRLDQIIPTQNVTDESAFFRNGNAQLIGAVEQSDGSLLVLIENITSASAVIIMPNAHTSDATSITFTPGQSVILPAGTWSEVESFLTNMYEITSQPALTGGFSAQILGAAASLVAFSEAGNMVTLGINSDYVAGAVSVGNSTTRRQITGVADAVAADDVVNLGQLSSTLGVPVVDLSDRVQSESSRLDGVSAMTAAISALQPNPRAAAPLSVSFGLGTYEGKTAAAMGFLWRASDTSHIQLSVAGSKVTTPQTAVSFKIVW